MTLDTGKRKTIVMPCSGIGKVHGLIAREAAYAAADEMGSECAQTLCLALLVSGDEESQARIRHADCVTIDGCPKLCAAKNVEMAGGNVVRSYTVVDAFKEHRGAQPGTATLLADDGWTIVSEIASQICRGCESEVK